MVRAKIAGWALALGIGAAAAQTGKHYDFEHCQGDVGNCLSISTARALAVALREPWRERRALGVMPLYLLSQMQTGDTPADAHRVQNFQGNSIPDMIRRVQAFGIPGVGEGDAHDDLFTPCARLFEAPAGEVGFYRFSAVHVPEEALPVADLFAALDERLPAWRGLFFARPAPRAILSVSPWYVTAPDGRSILFNPADARDGVHAIVLVARVHAQRERPEGYIALLPEEKHALFLSKADLRPLWRAQAGGVAFVRGWQRLRNGDASMAEYRRACTYFPNLWKREDGPAKAARDCLTKDCARLLPPHFAREMEAYEARASQERLVETLEPYEALRGVNRDARDAEAYFEAIALAIERQQFEANARALFERTCLGWEHDPLLGPVPVPFAATPSFLRNCAQRLPAIYAAEPADAPAALAALVGQGWRPEHPWEFRLALRETALPEVGHVPDWLASLATRDHGFFRALLAEEPVCAQALSPDLWGRAAALYGEDRARAYFLPHLRAELESPGAASRAHAAAVLMADEGRLRAMRGLAGKELLLAALDDLAAAIVRSGKTGRVLCSFVDVEAARGIVAE